MQVSFSPRTIPLVAGLGVLLLCVYRVVGSWSETTPIAAPSARDQRERVDRENLDEVRRSLETRGTKAFLVQRHGRIVYEWYRTGHGRAQQFDPYSLAKSLVGGMSLLVALSDGRIGLDDPVWKYVPDWQHDPFKSKITIRHLATHSSGFHFGTEEFWRSGSRVSRMLGKLGLKPSSDPFSIALNDTPILFEPGQRFLYSGAGFAVLGYAITASLKGTPHSDIKTLFRERIMKPIGIRDRDWSIPHPSHIDGMSVYPIAAGGSYTARAVAKIGQFMLQKGQWKGRQLVDYVWAERMVSYHGTPLPERSPSNPVPTHGLCWVVNSDGVWPSVPKDVFLGVPGSSHQLLVVIPSLDLVAVRFGNPLSDRDESFDAAIVSHVLNPLLKAIDRPPEAPNGQVS